MSVPVLGNQAARHVFLDRHLLGRQVPGDLAATIRALGFVQLDSVNTVARAHHMILSARSRSYRPAHLKKLMERDRQVFEHWTHDASVLPMEWYPAWQLKFARDAAKMRMRWRDWQGGDYEDKLEAVLDQIARTGACGSRDVGADEARSGGGWWDWHPSKTALEYLWRSGRLSVLRRDGFAKVYDLAERVIPQAVRAAEAGMTEPEIVDWAAGAALDRLGFATSGEIAAFWDLITPEEARIWCRDQLASGALIEVDIEGADGRLRRSLARPDLPGRALPEIGERLRVLSPFDPALRDRKRAARLFGFHYRIEIFVPEAKRVFGYYVFPILEGDRLIGRIDMRREGAGGVLRVRALWPEKGVAFGKGRLARLEAELGRIARFAECEALEFEPEWLRPALDFIPHQL